MSKAEFAALIALCAALASAIGDVIRQRSAQEITDKEVGLEPFRLSVRDRRWWLGGMGAIANYSLQAAALALGSVMLGVVVLGETLNTSGPRVFALLTAGVLVAVATIALARGEAATMAAGAGHEVVLRDEAVSNRSLRRAAQGIS
jgi:hypothetical protein